MGSRFGFRGAGAGPEILKKGTEAGWQVGLGREKSPNGRRYGEQSFWVPEAATRGDNCSSGHRSLLSRVWSYTVVVGAG